MCYFAFCLTVWKLDGWGGGVGSTGGVEGVDWGWIECGEESIHGHFLAPHPPVKKR